VKPGHVYAPPHPGLYLHMTKDKKEVQPEQRKSLQLGLNKPRQAARGGSKSANTSPSTSPAPFSRSQPNLDLKLKKAANYKSGSPSSATDTSATDISVTLSSPVQLSRTPTDASKCPCATSIDSWMIDCSKCHQYWHADCVSLNGIDRKTINKLLNYLCPFCYVAPIPTINGNRDSCLSCRNTEVLRDLNLCHEVDALTGKLDSLKVLDLALQHMDFDAIAKRLQTLETLDLHIQHLLLDDNLLGDHQANTKRMEDNINQLNKIMESHVLGDISPIETRQHDLEMQSVSRSISLLNERLDEFTSTTGHGQESPSSCSKIDEILSKMDNLLADQDATSHKSGTNQSVKAHLQPRRAKEPEAPPIKHGLYSTNKVVDEYITADEHKDLFQFLENQDSSFVKENGRTVLQFGEPYYYHGSKANIATTEFPELIKSLADRINKEFNPPTPVFRKDGTPGTPIPGPEVNQCLINKYTGEAFLPEHSDDETTIDPESSIFTISIGAKCDIIFKEKTTNEKLTHLCKPSSLYSMTRRSQEFYTHQIPTTNMGTNVRYSLTFRRSHWRYKNSLCLIGDSNTGKLHFGEAEGTFGFATPGSKKWAPHISDIDPISACSYTNVVVLCGINSVRHNNVGSNDHDVRGLYVKFKHKIEQIRSLNKRCNIFVCPILPTKSEFYNRKATMFNRFLFDDLFSSSCGVMPVMGFDDFLDERTLLLSERLSFQGDALHLNVAGGRILARHIKRAMFVNKVNRMQSRVHTSRPYSAVVMEGFQGDPV
jgi:hypothetical protein